MFTLKHSLKIALYASVFSVFSFAPGSLVAGDGQHAETLGLPEPEVKTTVLEKMKGTPPEDNKIEEEVSMTLESLLKHAYLNNPSLHAARAELKAAHERLPQAFAGWKPTVSSAASLTATEVDGSNFGGEGGGGDGSTAKDLSVSLDQPLFRGGSTFAEVAAARHTINAQTALLISREQDIMLEAISSYADVIRDQTLLKISQDTKNIIAKEFEATQDRFDVGELTKTDVSQAEARLARADSDVISARGDLNSSIANFVEVTGMVPKELHPIELDAQIPENLDAAIRQAEDTSPLVLFAEHAHRASEKDVDDVFGELLPSLSVLGSWAKSYDPAPGLIEEQTNKSIGLSASIPLYQAGAVRSRVRQAKHTANQRYMEILEARRDVQQQVVSSWSDWQAAKAEIQSRQSQLKASRVAQEGVRAEAEFGSRTVLDVLDADQEVFDADVALVNAQRNETVAKFSLLATLGQLLPETLGFSRDSYDYTENLEIVSGKIFDMHVDRVKEE